MHRGVNCHYFSVQWIYQNPIVNPPDGKQVNPISLHWLINGMLAVLILLHLLLMLTVYFHYESTILHFAYFSFVIVSGALNLNYSNRYDKVHIFWEGYKILQNLHFTFVRCSASQKEGEDFAKFSGLFTIYELSIKK